MGELQATVEFSVELFKFYNVDLFQRGFYQIRTTLKVLPKIPVKIEISLPQNPKTDLIFPACVVNSTAVSKTFQILYRNEEVVLNDVILYKVHVIVDSHKIEETIERADFQLVVELWFTDESFGPDQHSSIQCVSSRTLNLHFVCSKGLHHHLPILFDYFHLSAITMTIHASLVAVHQPYINTSRPGKPGWLLNSPRINSKLQSSSIEAVLFGTTSSKSTISGMRLSQARQIHREICSLLLSAYENLQAKLQEFMKLLPPWQQLRIESTDCYARLHNLSDLAKNVESEDDLIAIANSDIAQLCAENIILWQQFLEVFNLKDRIRQHLAREHHNQRVKRFAEGFFVIEHPRHALLSCSDNSYQTYQMIAETTRKSRYYTMLPPLDVECVEMDGSVDMLPIIFEDHYKGTTNPPSKINSSSDPGINIQDIDVNMRDKLDHNQEYGKISQSASILSPSTVELSPSLNPRQRRSPSVDTGTKLNKSLNSEIKESRSLNAEINCLSLSSCVRLPTKSPLSLDSKISSPQDSLKNLKQPIKSMPVISRGSIKNSLKLDLHNVGEFYSIPTGTLLSRSLKEKLRMKLRKAPLFKNNGNSLIPPISSLNSSSESVVLTGYKKLEQSISLPQNLTAHLTLPCMTGPDKSFLKLSAIHHAHSTSSMPNFPCSMFHENALSQCSESMPDLGGTISPSQSYRATDTLSWPSTSLMLLSPDSEATDTEQQDQSIDDVLTTTKTHSVESETMSLVSDPTSLPTPAEATSGQKGFYNNSASPTTCNSEFPSEHSMEWKSSQSTSSLKSDRRSDSHDDPKSLSTVSKSKDGGAHIYEEIHLPPEQFRDPLPKSSSTTQTGSDESTSLDFSYSVTDSDRPKGVIVEQPQKMLDIVHHADESQFFNGEKQTSLPTSPLGNKMCTYLIGEHPAHRDCNCHRNAFIPDIIKSIDREGVRSSYLNAQCTLFEMLTDCADHGSDSDITQISDVERMLFSVPPPPLPKSDKGKVYNSPDEFFDWESSCDSGSEKQTGDQTISSFPTLLDHLCSR